MRENVNKKASCAKFFDTSVFTYNRNQIFEAQITYLCVNIITKSENDHFNSIKIIL